MAKKEIKFKGLSAEELKNKSSTEFMELIPSSSRRTLKRGYTDEQKIFIEKIKTGNNVRTHCRDIVILPYMIDKTIHIHNGKEFVIVNITIEMLGKRLGEFALTRKVAKHTSKGKKQVNKRK